MAQCLRSHGVPNFPDPSPGSGLVIPNGINPNAPAFHSAQQACNKLLPSGPQAGAKPSESAKLAMLSMARCFRAHGLPDVPDPTTSPPPSQPPPHSLVLGRGGLFLMVPAADTPAFQRAAAVCHFPIPHARGPS